MDRASAARSLDQVDLVRLDHFRGFEAYWEIPAGSRRRSPGRWVEGRARELFEALEAALGGLPFVAEDLGVITPGGGGAAGAGSACRGCAMLQFAFGTARTDRFLPHNYERDTVAYTGTHDNDTVMGWWEGGAGDSVRTPDDVAREKARRARTSPPTDGR